MRVAVLCEYSGVVRDAFARHGHYAVSCDLLPSESPGPHYQGDVFEFLQCTPEEFDLAICHPPCTYLCSSGLHWNGRVPGRAQKTDEAVEFVKRLMALPIPRIAIENPIGCLSSRIRKPDQIIQPWQFGHPESKSTCLWLKGLPRLTPTNVLAKPARGYWDNQTPSGQNNMAPGPNRAKERARTYRGWSQAMAEQWRNT